MNGFFEYLENKKVKDSEKLIGFVSDFLKDPSIYFDLNVAERNELEQKLDSALAVFKDNETQDNKSGSC
jgi:urease accessory protein UreF